MGRMLETGSGGPTKSTLLTSTLARLRSSLALLCGREGALALLSHRRSTTTCRGPACEARWWVHLVTGMAADARLGTVGVVRVQRKKKKGPRV